MQRLILVTILITVVYSWEDLKRTCVFLVKSIAKQKYNPSPTNNLDHLVGSALILATLPVNLTFLLVADGSLMARLLVILGEFLLIGLVAEITEVIAKKFSQKPHYENPWIMAWSIGAGIVAPPFRVFGEIVSHRKLFGSYIKNLSFPIFFGLVLKWLTLQIGVDEVDAHLDPLIKLAVMGLILNATIDILEKFFRSTRLNLFSYFRIVLGLVIIVVLMGRFN